MNYIDEKQFRASRIKEVAAQFPGSTIHTNGDDEPHGFRLNGEEIVWIGFDRHKHRLCISGCWPRSKIPDDNSQFTPRDCRGHLESPSITVDANKSARQIARDINNRFLPDYRTVLVECIKARDQHDAYITDCNTTARTIAEACHGKVYGEGWNQHSSRQNVVELPGDLSGRFECSNGDASLTIRSLSTARAVELAKLLSRWGAEDDARKEVAS